MNKFTLIAGFITMTILGATIGANMNPQIAVGLGLLWIGLSVKSEENPTKEK